MKLFQKTFISLLTLLIGCVLIAYLTLYAFMPTFYKNYKKNQIGSQVENILVQKTDYNESQLQKLFNELADEYDIDVCLMTKDKQIIWMITSASTTNFVTTDEISDSDNSEEVAFQDEDYVQEYEYEITPSGDKSNSIELKYDVMVLGQKNVLQVMITLQPLNEAKDVLISIFPISALICVVISFIGAWIFARHISKPVQKIANATVEMSKLNYTEKLELHRSDEIGILAKNVDDLYDNLTQTIIELENKINEIGKTENSKVDFLRIASHELKTPISSVNALIEGMIYNVPPYNDHEKYLNKCRELLEDTNALIKNSIDLSNDRDEITNMNLLQTTNAVVKTFLLIAKFKKVEIDVSIEKDFVFQTNASSFKNAMSNIISNAIDFADENSTIYIKFNDSILSVENKCVPLSDEEITKSFEAFYTKSNIDTQQHKNGLGLYIIERSLKLCDLSYSFERGTSNSMIFKIDIN